MTKNGVHDTVDNITTQNSSKMTTRLYDGVRMPGANCILTKGEYVFINFLDT